MSTMSMLGQAESAILGTPPAETAPDGASPHSGVEGSHRLLFCLLALRRWPDIARLPAEEMVDVTRVCALLAMRSTAGVSIARILEIRRDRVQSALRVLHEQGCLEVQAQHSSTPGQSPCPAGDVAANSADDNVPSVPGDSFIRKIWQRLASLG